MSKYLIIITSIIFILTSCKPDFYHQITIAEIEDHISFLASDSLKGRVPGSPEDSVLANYITSQLDISGLLLLSDDGLQEVEVEKGYSISNNNYISTKDASLHFKNAEIDVLGFSSTGNYTGRAVLTDNIERISTHDAEDIILFVPFPDELPMYAHNAYSKLRSIALKAADSGVKGLIFINQGTHEIPVSDKRLPLNLPVFVTSQLKAIELLNLSKTINASKDLFEAIPLPYKTELKVSVSSEVSAKTITSYNTLAEIKGAKNSMAEEYIIIGAHHDHLGMGGMGSSSRIQDTVAVHYGADDNASGVAGLIELSQHLMSRAPSRSFIFSSFAAEEMGLLGSKEFVKNPPVDLTKVQLMINLDMIGRLNDQRQLQIGGVGTAPRLRSVLDSVNSKYQFSIAYSEAGYGPSDHSSFYAEDIPVLFISTGAHTDYHTPFDSKDKINYEGMQEVLSYISDVAYSFSELPDKLEFTMAGPKESSGSRGRAGMVTFGLMPDVMYDGNEGMPVSFVTEGKPAAIGGMKGGDIITAVDGKRVGNVHDYMERLSALKEGQSVIVTVDRDGESLDLLLKL